MSDKMEVEMSVKGAGGSEGGIGRFFFGLIMMIGGGYLFFNSIRVHSNYHFGGFGFGNSFGSFGGFSTSGYVLLPFLFGIGMMFYNSKNFIGWLLVLASLVMLVFGVITSINLRLVNMSAFQLISIIILMIGGLGMFLSSLKNLPKE